MTAGGLDEEAVSNLRATLLRAMTAIAADERWDRERWVIANRCGGCDVKSTVRCHGGHVHGPFTFRNSSTAVILS